MIKKGERESATIVIIIVVIAIIMTWMNSCDGISISPIDALGCPNNIIEIIT
jgi:hypothetical protein